jgi:hypothetical protein
MDVSSVEMLVLVPIEVHFNTPKAPTLIISSKKMDYIHQFFSHVFWLGVKFEHYLVLSLNIDKYSSYPPVSEMKPARCVI